MDAYHSSRVKVILSFGVKSRQVILSVQVKYFFIPVFKGKRGCHTRITNKQTKSTCIKDQRFKSAQQRRDKDLRLELCGRMRDWCYSLLVTFSFWGDLTLYTWRAVNFRELTRSSSRNLKHGCDVVTCISTHSTSGQTRILHVYCTFRFERKDLKRLKTVGLRRTF